MPPIFTPPGGWCLSPQGLSNGIASTALVFSPTLRNYLGGVLVELLAPQGITATQVQSALNTALSSNSFLNLVGPIEMAEQLTAMWQPTAYAVNAQASAIEALFNVAVSLRRVILPEEAGTAESNLIVAFDTLVNDLETLTTTLRQQIGASTAGSASQALQDAANALAAANTFTAEAVGTESFYRISGDLQVTAAAKADSQAVLDYATSAVNDLAATLTQVADGLAADLQQQAAITTQEITAVSQQAATDAQQAATQALAGEAAATSAALAPLWAGTAASVNQAIPDLAAENPALAATLTPMDLAVPLNPQTALSELTKGVKTLATTTTECSTPYCTEKNKMGRTLHGLSTLIGLGAIVGFITAMVADPSGLAVATDAVANALVDEVTVAIKDVVHLA